MSRFFVPPESVTGQRIMIRGEELHHARDVMRLVKGDAIVVFDGSGKEYHGIIEGVGKQEMAVAINKTVERRGAGARLTLVQALPKSDKMDLIVEKATELGVDRIIPVITERSVVRADEKKAVSKVSRWRKISLVASKQCGRTKMPEICDIISFGGSLEKVRDSELKIIPCLYEEAVGFKEALSGKKPGSAVIFIGPEGDFTTKEVDAAKGTGFVPVSLGDEILRSETAAICALSILNYELRW